MKSEEQEAFEREWHERRAQERAAWGQYAASERQNNLNEKLRLCRNKNERKAILDEAKAQNESGFWIG